MNLNDLLTRTRSYRRFYEDRPLNEETLIDLVALTRLCPSGANRQPLKYYLSCSPEQNATIFPHLGWAKWLPDWHGPEEGERPAGYIAILGDTRIAERPDNDAAIAAYTILLGATAYGLGGCMIAWIDREGLAETLEIPSHLRLLLVVALGHPKETIVLENATSPSDIAYWRDATGVHHVPKRPLEELLLEPELVGAAAHRWPSLTCLEGQSLLATENCPSGPAIPLVGVVNTAGFSDDGWPQSMEAPLHHA
jgi:nitroreductase